jgi:L-threonylcarbamoyladenylate synthase
MKILKLSEKVIKEVVKIINEGGVVVFPTDTVYGLICDATNKKAVEKIFKIKNREKDKVLPVFVSSIKKARKVAEIDKKQEEILKKYWPGKYTFVLKSKIQNYKSQINPKLKCLKSKNPISNVLSYK